MENCRIDDSRFDFSLSFLLWLFSIATHTQTLTQQYYNNNNDGQSLFVVMSRVVGTSFVAESAHLWNTGMHPSLGFLVVVVFIYLFVCCLSVYIGACVSGASPSFHVRCFTFFFYLLIARICLFSTPSSKKTITTRRELYWWYWPHWPLPNVRDLTSAACFGPLLNFYQHLSVIWPNLMFLAAAERIAAAVASTPSRVSGRRLLSTWLTNWLVVQ